MTYKTQITTNFSGFQCKTWHDDTKTIEDGFESMQGKQEIDFHCNKFHAGEEYESTLHRAEDKNFNNTVSAYTSTAII